MASIKPNWYWTDDLARLLQDAGRDRGAAITRWLTLPVAVRGHGDAMTVAEALLADEGDELPLAA
ncbi:MAG: hypothetical protein ACT4OP_04965 [Actinomycetota bacterium]